MVTYTKETHRTETITPMYVITIIRISITIRIVKTIVHRYSKTIIHKIERIKANIAWTEVDFPPSDSITKFKPLTKSLNIDWHKWISSMAVANGVLGFCTLLFSATPSFGCLIAMVLAVIIVTNKFKKK